MTKLKFELDLCLQKPKLPDNEEMRLVLRIPYFFLSRGILFSLDDISIYRQIMYI